MTKLKNQLKLLCLLLILISTKHKLNANNAFNSNTNGFIENKGQILNQNNEINNTVKYFLPIKNLNVSLKKNGFSYDTYNNAEITEYDIKKSNQSSSIKFHRIDIEFLNANPFARIIPQEEISATIYANIKESNNATTISLKQFSKIVYKNIYPNIDVEFISSTKNNKRVEYNFILYPGAKISDIKLKYTGALNSELINNEIKLELAHGTLIESIPLSYWANNNTPEKINYKILSKSNSELTIGFVGKTNTVNSKFIIDPTPNLSWATFYGGAGNDEEHNTGYGGDMVIDNAGNVIIVGHTNSVNFISTTGAYQTSLSGNYDIYIAKFTSSGILLWSTYYGGPDFEASTVSVDIDVSDNIFIAGLTTSTSGISTSGVQQPTFSCLGACNASYIAKFNSSGSIIWGRYFYGNLEAEIISDLDVDYQGNVLVCGWTQSSSGITTPGTFQSSFTFIFGAQVGFVCKFNGLNGNKIAGTYLSNCISKEITSDASGNIIVASTYQYAINGWSSTPHLNPNLITAGAPQTAFSGGQDIVVTKFNSTCSSLLWGTFYGGGMGSTNGNFYHEYVGDIGVDKNGNIYMCGGTETPGTAPNNLTTAGCHQAQYGNKGDGYLVKYSPSGAMLWATYYGGSERDYVESLALDNCGNIFIGGETASLNNISTANAYQSTPVANSFFGGGSWNVFIAKFNSSGVRQWGTYYGGSQVEKIKKVAIDRDGRIFVKGIAFDNTLPVTAGAYQTTHRGAIDAFVACFMDTATKPVLSISTPSVCPNNSATISVTGGSLNGAKKWYLYTSGCGITLLDSGNTFTVNPNTTTTYHVRGEGDCILPGKCDSIKLTRLSLPIITITGTNSICNGSSAQLTATGGFSYIWSNGATNQAITINPTTSTNYSVTGYDANGCSNIGTTSLTVNPLPTITTSDTTHICSGSTANLWAQGALAYNWTPAIGLNNNTSSQVLVNTNSSATYTVTGTDANGCSNTGVVNVIVNSLPAVNINPNPLTICTGASATLTASGATTYNWMPLNATTSTITISPATATTYSVIGTDNNGCSNIATTTVTLAAPLGVVIPTVNALCNGGQASLSANASGGTGVYTYNWQPGNAFTAGYTINPTSTTNYTVIISDNCSTPATAQITVTVNPLPTPSFTADKTNGCAKLCVTFTDNTPNTTTRTWNFGNGITNTQNSSTFCYNTAGPYSVSLTVTDNNGCSNSVTNNNYITVYPQPTANFLSSPVSTTITDPLIYFTDKSSLATVWNWHFGDEANSTSNTQHPSFTYNDTGNYNVRLIVTNEFGCTDTAYDVITIKQDYLLYIPNTFTPNNDGMNEIFLPVISGVEENNFELIIYDRWGTQIFKTNNPNQGWDGRANGGSEIAQQDVYVWKLSTTDIFRKKHQYNGHVNLIR